MVPPRSDLFAAALYTNTLSIVKQCHAEMGECISSSETWKNGIAFVELAARYGDIELLTYLMTRDTTSVDKRTRNTLFENAVLYREMGIVEFLYRFNISEMPWYFGNQPSIHEECINLNRAIFTTNLPVLDFIQELRKEHTPGSVEFLEFEYPTRLSKSLCSGSSDVCLRVLQEADEIGFQIGQYLHTSQFLDLFSKNIVSTELLVRLLESGAHPERVLAAAIGSGKIDLVQQLLSRGVQPLPGELSIAALRPCLGIVHLLLDFGVDVNESVIEKTRIDEMRDLYGVRAFRSPLECAIECEHTSLFNLLIERGAELHTREMEHLCVSRAKINGLESMLKLLKVYGVDVDATNI
ncbi:hypothetical protein GQ44DRAFT_766860 [Phaeosphaeriaceae sp. PMI808]|nr:hypothetical protein GQ44DRAFT_766860 [Phaeosphaeriaceae sp. PMI808]